MDYANERWVRLYVRDTTTWKLLPWEAKALLALALRKVDRSGVLDVGDEGHEGLAAQVEMPPDVVEVAVGHLLKRGVLAFNGHAYVFPNFIDAQETPASDRQRAIESRANRRAKAMEPSQNVTPESRNVTQPSRAVTAGHAASRAVTPSDPSVPSDPANPTQDPPYPPRGGSGGSGRKKAKPTEPTPEQRAVAMRVLAKLGDRTGIAYEGRKSHVDKIAARLRDGITERELRGIAAYCWSELRWSEKPEMHQYLRPETLYGPVSVDKYLDGARAWLAKNYPEERQAVAPPASTIGADLFARHTETA